MAALGVAALGTVATVGIFYGDELGKNSVFAGLANVFNDIAQMAEVKLMADTEPTGSLSEDEKNYQPYSTSATTDKDILFGVKYGKLLVSDTDSTWRSKNVNSRKDLIDDTNSKIFKGIKGATDLQSFVKGKCKAEYEKKASEVEQGEDISNIWMLCSPIKSKPLSVSTLRIKYQGKLASKSVYAPYFLEDRAKNKYAWEMLYEKLVKTSNEDEKSDEFKAVDKGYSSTDDNSLNQACAKAYSDDASKLDASDKYKKNVLKFCTFTTLDLTATQ